MQTNEQTPKDPIILANRFIENLELYLEQTKKQFGMNVSLTLPLSKDDFDIAFKMLDLIQTLAKEKNISVNVADEDESLKEYGHTYCFDFSRI